MDCQRRARQTCTDQGHSHLKYVNLEHHDNHVSHQTLGLSSLHLVVRRGKAFKITLLFSGGKWDPAAESLAIEVCLGNLWEVIPVWSGWSATDPLGWRAHCFPGDVLPQSVTIHLCAPVLSAVGIYSLLVCIHSSAGRQVYRAGHFVLLCNPWLKDDPVYMPLDVHKEEYVKSDFGIIYTGTHLNICKRPWSFGQYEPGVLEACLNLLQLSPQHLRDQQTDYVRRANPIYLSRVLCAMVNCNDDRGVLEGKWNGSYRGGTGPTDWAGSADILIQWATSNFSPVRYGQCWVFASVLCTVMRALGIPSRVVTVFDAAHDTNGNLIIEETYTTRGRKCERLGLSRDSIWNFHVWVECWMRRPDLGAEFDGWQVVDPTPQERSAGVFCCGPCPVLAVQRGLLRLPYDTSFVFASIDADVVRLILRRGLVLGRTVDTDLVGQLVCTKSVGSDNPENLTQAYKGRRKSPSMTVQQQLQQVGTFNRQRQPPAADPQHLPLGGPPGCTGGAAPTLEVSLAVEKVPSMGEAVRLRVTVANRSARRRVLRQHLNAQLKEYDGDARQPFWQSHGQLQIMPGEVLRLKYAIAPSDYESVLTCEDIVNLAVVIKDVSTRERVLAAEEFNIEAPQISIEVQGGDGVRVRTERAVHVAFTNTLTQVLCKAELAVEGSGLLQGKCRSSAVLLQPGQVLERKVSIMAASAGTKLLMATVSHSNGHCVIARTFHRVHVTEDA